MGRSQIYCDGSILFWKSGTPLQRSLEGRLCSLVYIVLDSLPHLIPRLFSRYWSPRLALPWLERPGITIGYEAIRKVFEDITDGLPEMRNQCFCFFIDGLDEFDDPNPTENYTYPIGG
jgi:hypothetical protein